jgi:hypothetical protein
MTAGTTRPLTRSQNPSAWKTPVRCLVPDALDAASQSSACPHVSRACHRWVRPPSDRRDDLAPENASRLSGRLDLNQRPPAPKGHSGFAGGRRRAGQAARTSRFGVSQSALLGPHTRVGASLVRPGIRAIPVARSVSCCFGVRSVSTGRCARRGVVAGRVRCIARVLGWLPVLPRAHTPLAGGSARWRWILIASGAAVVVSLEGRASPCG